jgi:hypothetical protein
MPGMHRPVARARRPIPTLLAIVALIAAGCTTTSTSPSGTAPAQPTATAVASGSGTPVPIENATPGATQPGQTDTDWERIWDDVPSGFPVYPGAHPTETGGGPASAVLDAGAAGPAAVVNWYQTALAAANYKAVSSDGPREDGSFELILSGPLVVVSGGTCDIRITATPLGGSTIITVMYGAGCPFS